MRSPPRPLILFHSDRLFAERVRTAARVGYTLHSVSSWEALADALRTMPASAVAIVDPLEGVAGRKSLAPELVSLFRMFPSATILPALEVRSGCFDLVKQLALLGASEVICLDEDHTPIALRGLLDNANGAPLRNLIARHLPPTTSGPAQSIIQAAASVAIAGGDSATLAREFYITTRTLLRWCRRAGLPAPRRLLLWMRILIAAELLDDPGRAILDVALSCGYASDGSLRNAIQALLGTTPSHLRARGAFPTASVAFAEGLIDARAENARYRRPAAGHRAAKR